MVLAAGGLVALRGRIYREVIVTDVLLVFLFALFCGGMEATVVALFHASARWGGLLALASGQAILTALLCPLVFAACNRFGLVDRHEPAGAG